METLRLGIMQPYFVPYLGYFQLINACERFILYDNIKYTKKGWINRNRIMVNGNETYLTLPLKNNHDSCMIIERELANWDIERENIKRKLNTYNKYPYYEETKPLIESIFNYQDINLFWFVAHSVQVICYHLGIETPIFESSQIDIDHELKSEQRIVALCKEMDCNEYINAIGGELLYKKDDFLQQGIELLFLRMDYHIPSLSVIDLLMIYGKEQVKQMLNKYELI